MYAKKLTARPFGTYPFLYFGTRKMMMLFSGHVLKYACGEQQAICIVLTKCLQVRYRIGCWKRYRYGTVFLAQPDWDTVIFGNENTLLGTGKIDLYTLICILNLKHLKTPKKNPDVFVINLY